jgi:hypothetical protein
MREEPAQHLPPGLSEERAGWVRRRCCTHIAYNCTRIAYSRRDRDSRLREEVSVLARAS